MISVEKAERLKYEYWDDVCDLIDEKIQLAKNRLVMCSPEELRSLQERVKAFEEIKGLPDAIIEERSPKT